MNRPAPRRPTDWSQYLASRAETARHPLLRDFYRANWPDADTPLAELEFAALRGGPTGFAAGQYPVVSVGAFPFSRERLCSPGARKERKSAVEERTAESVTFHLCTN